MRMKRDTKKIALAGIMTALTLILSLIENMLPPIIAFLPYARIGFANIAILVSLILFGYGFALSMTIIKCVFAAIFSGAITALFYSIPSSLVSLTIAYLMLRYSKEGMMSISAISAVFHNLIQVLVAMLITKTAEVYFYLPHLTAVAIVTGSAIGLVVYLLVRKVPFDKLLNFESVAISPEES